MSTEHELWPFVAERLHRNEPVMLLVVAESSGSSPGRAGYKMAVACDGALCGSIGGGAMEVALVEQAKERGKQAVGESELKEQVHRKNDPNASGMICSGSQTVIFRQLTREDVSVVEAAIDALASGRRDVLALTDTIFAVHPSKGVTQNIHLRFERNQGRFLYQERLGPTDRLYIVGGGHCALALSELMSKMDFRISVFDDRPDLNTIAKNKFADDITIIEDYNSIGDHIPNDDNIYVVVMTLGCASDTVVMRSLMEHDLKYFGVLGSKAKMTALLRELRKEGYDAARLKRIRTPIGIPINSRTPAEIAVSIAAEIIQTKNK